MPENNKRQTAYKIKIKDLLEGNYVVEDGWKPNYVITPYNLRVSRVNLVGVVLEKIQTGEAGKQETVIIDDGSGKIGLRSFEENKMLSILQIGDMIAVIGRPREYGSEKYIVPEIIKQIKDKKWIEVRKLEHMKIYSKLPRINQEEINVQHQDNALLDASKEEIITDDTNEKVETTSIEKVIQTIKELDSGDGADIEEVKKGSDVTNSEEVLDMLLKRGDLFTIRPGRVKILE